MSENAILDKIIDLLRWMKETGVVAASYSKEDRFVDPFTKTIRRGYDLKPHQKELFLWLPRIEPLQKVIPEISMEKIDYMVVVRFRQYLGCGKGETEALLSLAHDIRLRTA